MADKARINKVADHIRVTVASMVGRLKDPRLGFVTVTDVEVSGDLQQAKVYYTVLGEDADRKSTQAALNSARGLIRSEVGKNLGIRLTPSLEFILDDLTEKAAALEGAVEAALAHDREVAAAAAGKAYAGEADPYKKPRAAADADADAAAPEEPAQ